MKRPLTFLSVLIALIAGCNPFSSGPPQEPPNLPVARPADTYIPPAPEPPKWLLGKPMSEWAMSETASDALRRIGQPAVRSLIPLLSDSDEGLRLQAIQILAGIGPEAVDAVPALRNALHDRNPLIRKWAARALGQIGPTAGAAVPELIEALRNDKT